MNNSQLHYCIDVDIKSFFDEVDHGKLLKQIWSLGIKDKRLIRVISKMLKSEINGEIQIKGTPQGGVLSPLLANIVLNELDWWISNQYETKKLEGDAIWEGPKTRWRVLKRTNLKEIYIVRYADDFKIMCRDYVTAVKALNAIKQWLQERLNLRVSEKKTKIINLRRNYSDFLGVKLIAKPSKGKYYAKSRISDSRVERIKRKLRLKVKEIKAHPTGKTVYKYNLAVLGSHNYYSRATNVFKDFKRIHYEMIPTLRNAFKIKGKYGIWDSKLHSLQERYFKKRSYRTWNIDGEPLVPIVDVSYKTNLGFTQDKTPYTSKGRELLGFQNLEIENTIRQLHRRSKYEDDIELLDNKISKFSAQQGKCEITGIFLGIGLGKLHHKKPREQGGNSSYRNIVWIHKDVHKLIHATHEDTIRKYLTGILNQDYGNLIKTEILEKVNKYRIKAKLKPIGC